MAPCGSVSTALPALRLYVFAFFVGFGPTETHIDHRSGCHAGGAHNQVVSCSLIGAFCLVCTWILDHINICFVLSNMCFFHWFSHVFLHVVVQDDTHDCDLQRTS